MKLKTYIFIGFLGVLTSCEYLQLKNDKVSDEVVASVGKKHLYKRDLLSLYTTDLDRKDSLLITHNFIETWARKQIFLQKSSLNISIEKERILEKMVDEYREYLFINTYKEALVSQNLDTIIRSKTIEDFYIANQNIFRLNEEMIQFKYISFDNKNELDAKSILKLFKADDAVSVEKLLEEELKFSIIQLNDSVWFTYSDFLKEAPIVRAIDKKRVLNNNYFFQSNDGKYTHFVKINTFLKRNEIAPLEYVKPVIKQMIIHQKKLKYIKDLEDQLIDEAIQNETYKTK